MAESEGKSADQGGTQRKGPGLKTIIVLAAFFVIEAAVIGVTYWLAGSPPDVTAETTTRNLEAWRNAEVEVPVVDDRFPNSARGPTFLYETKIYILVKRRHQEQVKNDLKNMEAQVLMDVATIFRRAQPEHLNEPTFATIKRQVKEALDERLGRDEEGNSLVLSVVITKCIPHRLES